MGTVTRLEGRAPVLALVAATAAALAYAYTFTFSQFVPYDDEGYFTVTVQHLLDGHRLYDDVPVPYGPFFYLSRWLIHGALRVPLVTDAVRLITIGHWLLCAALLAAVTYRLSHRRDGRLWLTTITFVAMVLQLSTAAREPGHPQELAALLIGVVCLLATFVAPGQRSLACGLLGAAAGASLLVKINVGVFLAAGMGVALVLLGPTGGWWRLVRRGSIVVIALPFALLRRDVGQLWAAEFCAVTTVGIALAWIVAYRIELDVRCTPRDVFLYPVGMLCATVVTVGFMMLRGTSLAGLWSGAVLQPVQFPLQFGWPVRIGGYAVLCGAMSAALLLLYETGGERTRARLVSRVLPPCKLGAAGFAIGEALTERWGRTPETLLTYGPAFLWLALVPPIGVRWSPREAFGRTLLCLIAAPQVLIAYPVPGSQVLFGTMVIVVIGVLLLSDVLVALESAGSPQWVRIGRLGCVASVAAVLAALGFHASGSVAAYAYGRPLNVDGGRLLRLPLQDTLLYQWLVDNVEASSDTFVSPIGLNSLYSWTHRKPAGPVVIGNSWKAISASQQQVMVGAHQAYPNLVVIDHPGFFEPMPRDSAPFLIYIDQQFRPVARFGPYLLKIRNDRKEFAPSGCAYPGSAEAGGSAALVLRLGLPPRAIAGRVASVTVVDLYRDGLIADTASGDARLQASLHNGAGQTLLARGAAAVDMDVLRRQEGLVLTFPNPPAGGLGALPAVCLMDGDRRRLLTLPVVQALALGAR